ncbi:hypothetical protein D9Q98_006104 [Chlorella vulgaris]|uniref:Uncharacterized protein n=1 Tax=Chlorella vulgaris TaxID=3077 RepID=A0A9D4TWX3_CHLVU|nr:hypothetical protein D9Q98_006104 [Chlorella vulgaris]
MALSLSTVCSLRPAVASAPRQRVAAPSASPLSAPLRPAAPARRVAAAASSKPADFDELLMLVAEKFEKADNKPVVIGYLAAAIGAIVAAEWFIHLPLFNILLGFPIQFIGLIATPYLALRYYVDKEAEPLQDVEKVVNKVTAQLPGLGKK